MIRRMFTFAYPLLACSLVILWIRSTTHYEFVQLETAPHHAYTAISTDGHISLIAVRYGQNIPNAQVEARSFSTTRFVDLAEVVRLTFDNPSLEFRVAERGQWFCAGAADGDFNGWQDPPRTHYRRWYVRIPYWAVTLAMLVLPGGVCLRTALRRHRHPRGAGFCSACGYDLRASKDRCPECGRRVPSPGGINWAGAPGPADDR